MPGTLHKKGLNTPALSERKVDVLVLYLDRISVLHNAAATTID